MTASQLLSALEKIAADGLAGLVTRALARSDDALFDLSQNGEGAEQPAYFGAMRELRRERAAIEAGWREAVRRRFADLRNAAAAEGIASDSLSLVDADALEEQLACEQAAATIERVQAEAIGRYRAGLARVMGRQAIEATDDPLSALALATAFRDLLAPAVTELRARLVILKWFERHLLGEFGDVLDASVRHLAAHGVSVELPPRRHPPRPALAPQAAPARAAAVPTAGTPTAAEPSPVAEDSDAQSLALYRLMCGLFASYLGTGGGGAAPVQAPAQPGRPRLPTTLVLALLGRLQSEPQPALLRAIRDGQRELGTVLREQILERAQRERAAPAGAALLDRDEQGLALVGMLFDVLLDQSHFGDDVRQRLALLVIPYARIALEDQRLFAHKSHPARRLLNALAEACEGNLGASAADRELLVHATATIDHVLRAPATDADDYAALEQKLRAQLDQRERRSALAEKRSTETQRGRERLDEARRDAELELASLVAGRPAPRAIAEFLRSNWTHHLTMVALRDGVDSDAYRRARAAGVSLWLAMLACERGGPVPDTLDHTLLPVLASGGMDAEAAAPALAAVRTALASLRPDAPPPSPAATADDDDPATPLQVITADPGHAPATLKSEIAGDADSLRITVEERSERAAELQQARALEAGTWVDLTDDDGAVHAAKLSWISPISERRLFVSRRGLRLCTLSPLELAGLIALGRLRVHAATTPVERALTDVVGRIRERQGAVPLSA